MLIGIHKAKDADLLSVDLTRDPPVVIERFSLGNDGFEDIEGLVWPDDCFPPVSGNPTYTPGPTSPIPTSANTPVPTRTPTATPPLASTEGYSVYCPL